jgi:hypothetical protein
MRRVRATCWCAAIVIAALTASCADKSALPGVAAPAGQPAGSARVEQRLDHISPARDSVGSAPKTFSWTKVEGADSYSIGVWNEVDVLVWRQNDIPATSVSRPEDVQFEPGTYFWSVSALRNGEEVADSGLSAFVVRTGP